MKLILCLFVTMVWVAQGRFFNEEQRNKIRRITKQCLEESGVDNNLLLQTKRGVFAEDQKLKDFLFCSFKNSGYQNSEGVLQEDVIRSHFSFESRALRAFESCFGQSGSDGAEIAFKTYKCFRNNLPEDLKLVL